MTTDAPTYSRRSRRRSHSGYSIQRTNWSRASTRAISHSSEGSPVLASLRRHLPTLRRHLPTIIEVVGIISVCAGVLWYSIPAGLIVTGIVAVVVAQGIGRLPRDEL